MSELCTVGEDVQNGIKGNQLQMSIAEEMGDPFVKRTYV